MTVARIILEGQVSGGKVVGVYPNRGGTESAAFITLRHVVKGGIAVYQNHVLPAFSLSQQGQVRSGDNQLFPVDTLTDMKDCGSNIGIWGRI